MTAVILRAAQATASAVTDALPTKDVQLATSMDVGNVLRVIITLVLIIAGAYLLTRYIAKRSLRRGMKQQPRGPKGSASSQYPEFGHLVSVADRIAVDRDKTLMVVEFEGKYYLLGTTSDGFQRLAEAEIPPETGGQEEEMPPEKTVPPDESTFGQRFRKAFGIVLRSYLPAGMRQETAKPGSFDAQLKAKIREDSKTAGAGKSQTAEKSQETPEPGSGAEPLSADENGRAQQSPETEKEKDPNVESAQQTHRPDA